MSPRAAHHCPQCCQRTNHTPHTLPCPAPRGMIVRTGLADCVMHVLLQAATSGTAGDASDAAYRRMKSTGRQAVASRLAEAWPRTMPGGIPVMCRPVDVQEKDQQVLLQSIWNWAVSEGLYAVLQKQNLSTWEDLVNKWGATKASDLLAYLRAQKTKYALLSTALMWQPP